ncbi:fibrinogen gamma chain-like [Mercenaria mercenaria]|uniref:fibrinogen gamma chain-like n=1 Tax=Mercenaria mercenaria TaxID=6596 RepID=UPI00234EB791|nr:fibrinogen gamma chain-like [Mercenaria mercenaria]
MGRSILCLLLAVFEAILNPAMSLTCLQCSNIPRPLHCRTVVDCYEGEMCGIEKVKNNFGEDVYNVGCMSKSKCSQSNGTRDCTECCSSNLCNVKGCGEQGYPKTRGPICYNCKVYTDSAKCHNIEFCEAGELCMFNARREFSETVYTSACANVHNCEQENLEIIGRDLENRNGDYSRSVKEHVCHHCCKQDLCNRNCMGTISATGAHDCKDVLKQIPNARSGIYDVTLWRTDRKITVLCDMDTDGGGWTVFQRRVNGSVDFNRNFSEYENGFGSLNGEFWLGLNKIQEFTGRGVSELRLDLVAANGTHAYELFQNFSLGIAPSYKLHFERGTGTAGDAQGLSYSRGYNFITPEKDNSFGCAKKSQSGWWFYGCLYTNLNAEYLTPGSNAARDAGFEYFDFTNGESLRESKMMLRMKHS